MSNLNPATRLTLVSATAALSLLLASTITFAQTASDLDCEKCVETGDIAQRTITTGKLKNGSVRENKLGRDVRDRLDGIDSRFEYVSFPGAAARPSRPGSVARISANGAIGNAQSEDTFNIGAIQLPHGMTVESMSCTVRDRDSTAYMQVLLLRADQSADGSLSGTDLVASTGTSRPMASEDLIVLGGRGREDVNIVDNSLYHYLLRVDMLDSPTSAETLTLSGCRIALTR